MITLVQEGAGQSNNCAPVPPPWLENFDSLPWQAGTSSSMGQIDTCWSRPGAGINTVNFRCNSGLTPVSGTGPSGDVSGNGNYLYAQAVGNAFQTGEITTPPIIIPSGVANVHLKFAFHMYGSFIDYLKVEVDSGSGFGNAIKTISGQQQTSSSAPWKLDSISLNPYRGDTLRIKFLARNLGTKGDIAIDNVEITLTQACQKPANLSLVNRGSQSLEISWTSFNGSSSSVLTYQKIGSPNVQTVYPASSPELIQGLMPATDYVVSVFDSCASAQSQVISDTFTTTLCDTVSTVFSHNPSYLGVNFTSNSAHTDSLFWDFGDGQNDTAMNPFHQYQSSGTYQVQLFAFNECDSDTFTVTVKVCDTLRAAFSFFYAHDTLVLMAHRNANASAFIWDLDDNKSDTGASVRAVYDSLGMKFIRLTVYNNCGDTLTYTDSISLCPAPVADWSYKILPPTSSGLRVEFDGSTSKNAVVYIWDFGDGTIDSSGAVVQHIFATPGLFHEVELTVKNSCSVSDKLKSTLQDISVEVPPSTAKYITAFPNPVSETLKLKWQGDFKVESIKVLNTKAKVLKRVDVSAQSTFSKINFSNYQAGLYFIVITGNEETASLRVLKQ